MGSFSYQRIARELVERFALQYFDTLLGVKSGWTGRQARERIELVLSKEYLQHDLLEMQHMLEELEALDQPVRKVGPCTIRREGRAVPCNIRRSLVTLDDPL